MGCAASVPDASGRTHGWGGARSLVRTRVSSKHASDYGLGPIVWLHVLEGLPRNEFGYAPSTHVKMYLLGGPEKRGRTSSWPPREAATDPAWSSARRLRALDGSFDGEIDLHVEVFEEPSRFGRVPSLLATLTMPLAQLRADRENRTPALESGYELELSGKPHIPGSAKPRVRIELGKEPPPGKTLFLVRHGESVWNKAQSELNLVALASAVDHPLNGTGRAQAEALQKKVAKLVDASSLLDRPRPRSLSSSSFGDRYRVSPGGANAPSLDYGSPGGALKGAGGLSGYERAFVDADLIASSPLTRALQTCVIGLSPLLRTPSLADEAGRPVHSPLLHLRTPSEAHGMLAAGSKEETGKQGAAGVRLMANLREKKNLGGFDSTGSAIGHLAVTKHLNETTAQLYAHDTERGAAVLGKVRLDTMEVEGKWWSDVAESKAEVAARVSELLWQLQFAPEQRIILVGHSHFFRELFKALSSRKFFGRDASLAKRLGKKKLPNGGVAAVELNFSERDRVYAMFGEEKVFFFFFSSLSF